MPENLTFKELRRVHGDRDGVYFQALTPAGTVVHCLVSDEALSDKERLTGARDDQLLAAFDRKRTEIHAIARWKHRAGAIEADGWIIVKTAELDPR